MQVTKEGDWRRFWAWLGTTCARAGQETVYAAGICCLCLASCADTSTPLPAPASERPGGFVAVDAQGGIIAPAVYKQITRAESDSILPAQSVPAGQERGDRIQPIRFKALTMSDGLPFNSIRGLHVDRDGYLWIAYGNGIIRYDGYDFVYLDEARPMHPAYGSFHEDSSGDIWVGSAVGPSLRWYQREGGLLYKLSLFEPDSHLIIRIGEDQRGHTIVLSSNLAETQFTLTQLQHRDLALPTDTNWVPHRDLEHLVSELATLPPQWGYVSDFAITESGEIWLIVEEGVGRLDDDGAELVLSGVYCRPGNEMTMEGDSAIWVGLDDQIMRLSMKSERPQFYTLPAAWLDAAEGVEYMTEGIGSDRRLTISGFSRNNWPERLRIFDFDPVTESFTWFQDQTKRSIRVMSFSPDRFGNQWVGTFDGEILKTNKESSRFAFYPAGSPESISGEGITALCEATPGIIWMGTADGRLRRWDRASGSVTDYRHEPGRTSSLLAGPITSLLWDSQGQLWVGTGSGLCRMRSTGAFDRFVPDPKATGGLNFPSVLNLFEDAQGTIWVSTGYGEGAGILYYDPDCRCLKSNDALDGLVTEEMVLDSNGVIWFGSGGGRGLHSFDPVADQSRHHHTYGNQQTMSIWIDQHGSIWEGQWNMPLMKYEPGSGSRIAYDLLDLYPGNPIRVILEDDLGMLWLGCGIGLIHFDPQREVVINAYRSDRWMAEDAEWSIDQHGIRCEDGTIMIGSPSGLLVFDPSEMTKNTIPPQTAITSVEATGEPVSPPGALPQRAFRDRIVLPYRSNDLVIRYTGLHLKDPVQNKFAYQLAGWDDGWIAAGTQRFASYSNLAPGTYAFRVRAANSDGVWLPADQAVVLPLLIRPPWWATWWAYTLYGLLIAGSLWSVHLWRTRAQRRKLAEQKRINAASARFVPSAFLQAIGRQNILEVQLGDLVEREVTVLFSDIRDFTSISENLTPVENFEFVNAYSRQMGPIIQENNGFVNQYLGDGVMAIFPERPTDALRAAIAMQKALDAFNQGQSSNSGHTIRIGTGLHSGLLIMGILGDRDRLDAATISDAVNTASRIESLTKYYGASIILSEDTRRQLDGEQHFNLRYLGRVQVKGKQKPLDIYECFDADAEAQKMLKRQNLAVFDQGVSHFLAGSFVEAQKCFQELVAMNPKDTSALTFLSRSSELARKGVPEGWTGVEEVRFI